MVSSRKNPRQAISLFSTHLLGTQKIHVPFRTLVGSFESSLNEAEKQACEVVEKGDGLAKIIPTEMLTFDRTGQGSLDLDKFAVSFPWRNHLEQLADYSIRPDAELDGNFSGRDQWRYNHLTQHIEKTEKTEHSSTSYSYTQETSTTLISSKLHTPLYTAHEGCNAAGYVVPAGLLYNRQACEIAAMFADVEIANTAMRRWISTRVESLVKYKQDIAGYSFTSMDLFKQHVDQLNNDRCNEVLAKTSRESVCALLIDATEMSNEAIKSSLPMIRERRAQLKDKLNLDLPVLFYHAERHDLRVYTQDELDLVELKEQLEKKLRGISHSTHLPALSLFAPEDLSYSFAIKGFMQGHVDRKTAIDIIKLISTYEKEGLSGHRAKEIVRMKCGSFDHLVSRIVI